jgi:Leucine Rich repeats (2 copies)
MFKDFDWALFEVYAVPILLTGAAIVAVGYLWLLVRAFRRHVLWGLACLLPPVGLLYLLFNLRRMKGPAVVLLLGGLITAAPFAVNYYALHFIDLGPRAKTVDGELHLTLTGWDLPASEYPLVLAYRKDAVVVQMANPDVTDATLEYLSKMENLRELDLNDTQVTDAGLAVIAKLPSLKSLRLARTKITDAGFRQHLLPLEGLTELDLTRTPVKGPTAREWKAAKPGRKILR